MKPDIFLHLGEDVTVRGADIVGVFDLEATTVSKKTRDYLSAAEKRGDVQYINFEMPKSFVVCRDPSRESGRVVYVSQLSLQTLTKRIETFHYENFE